MRDNRRRKVPDVLAFPLDQAREILQQKEFKVEVIIYGEPKIPGRNILRAARQKLNQKDKVEIVAVYALDEVIDEV